MAEERTHRRKSLIATALCAGSAIGGVGAAVLAFGWHPTGVGGDAWNYLAAGERLNSGHALYALSPFDRPVPLLPPYWSVPLLAPPPIAVAWRVLAPIGDAAMVLWCVGGLLAVAATVLVLSNRPAFWPLIALLAAPVTLTALSGNASAFILAALVAAWAFRGRPWIVGTLVAAMVAVKLTPVSLLLWLVATRRYRATWAALAIGLAMGAASLAGAGPEAWRSWLEFVPVSKPSPLAISTLLSVPAWTVVLVALAMVAGTWIVTQSDRATFAAAVLAAAFATPALYFQALALPLAMVALWAPRHDLADPRSISERLARAHDSFRYVDLVHLRRRSRRTEPPQPS